MKKRKLSVLIVLSMITTVFNFNIVAHAVSINDSSIFVKQPSDGDGTCVFTSCLNMFRRRAIIDGRTDWNDITHSNYNNTITTNGTSVRWTITNVKGMNASMTSISSKSTAEKKNYFMSMLSRHPEGIVIYCGSNPVHTVLLTDYTSGTFYCVETLRSYPAGRIPLTSTYIGKNLSQDSAVSKISQIWYITNKSGTPAATTHPTITSILAKSKSSVSLSWTPVSGATSYKIYRRIPDESWAGLPSVATASSTSYTDNNLKNGQKYYYRVTAVSSSVESEQSETAAVYTLPTEPSALKATSIKKSGLTLSWKSVSGADKYNIYRRLPGESWAGRQPIGTVTSTSYTDSGLSAGTKYYYRVTAVNDGGEGEQSESLDVYTAPTEPNMPVTTSIKDTSVAIKWNAVSSATSYNIYRRLAGGSWAGLSPIAKTKSTSYTDSSVQKGTHYYYRVTAVNDYAEGEQSESLSVYTAYLISYNVNGGTGNVLSQYKQYNVQLTLPTTKPTRMGYTFKNWNTMANGSGTSYTSGGLYTANSAAILYAQWTANSYNVTFNANGGTTSTENKNVTYASTYGALPIPVKEGYSFKGWYTAPSGGTQITAASKVTNSGNHTLYAVWEQVAYTIEYNLNNGIGDIDSQTYNYGTTASISSVIPQREGYRFLGWASSANSAAAEYLSGDIYDKNENITLYAVWKIIPSLNMTVTEKSKYSLFDIDIFNADIGDLVILALYKNGKLQEMQKEEYNGNNVSLASFAEYDTAKTMLWKDIMSFEPRCECKVYTDFE